MKIIYYSVMHPYNIKQIETRLKRKAKLVALRAKGKTIKELAAMFGVSRQAIEKVLR